MRRFARLGAYVASATLAVTGMTVIAPSAQAADNPAAKQAAASWLASQLTSNGLFGGTCSYDCGNDIDAGFSLLDIGTQSSTVTSMKTHLQDHVLDYITGEAFDDTGSTYAGATAKSLAFADAAGIDPTTYGSREPEDPARVTGEVRWGRRRPDLRHQHLRRLREHPRPGLRRSRTQRLQLDEGTVRPDLPAQAAVRVGLLPAGLQRTRRCQPELQQLGCAEHRHDRDGCDPAVRDRQPVLGHHGSHHQGEVVAGHRAELRRLVRLRGPRQERQRHRSRCDRARATPLPRGRPRSG